MLERLTPAQYRSWELYWLEEPWGPWRDNLHAAMIARETRRPWMRRGAQIDLDTFMIRRREEDSAQRVNTFIQMLYMMSKPVSKAKPKAKKPPPASKGAKAKPAPKGRREKKR